MDDYGAESDSLFVPDSLAKQVARDSVRVWRHGPEYLVVGYWRRRSEIRTIIKMNAGPHAAMLYRQMLRMCFAEGVKLLIVDAQENYRNADFYRRRGFGSLDKLVEYEAVNWPVLSTGDGIIIRDFQPCDVTEVLTVDHSAFPWLWWNSREELLWYNALPGVKIYVTNVSPSTTENADQGTPMITGYAGITVTDGQGHLDRLAVREDYQGLGHGETLLAHVLGEMARRRIRRVALTTQATNRRSQQLYRKFGFQATGWTSQMIGKYLGDWGEG